MKKSMKIGISMALMVFLVSAVSATTYTAVYPKNSNGQWTTLFTAPAAVYATGIGFDDNANEVCRVYVMENGDWTKESGWTCPLGGTGGYCVDLGASIPSGKIVTGPVDVTIGGDGSFGLTQIWASSIRGEYDVLVDCKNSGGNYGTWDGETNDGARSLTCQGFFVVPESVIAVALIALLVPGMIYVVRKRR